MPASAWLPARLRSVMLLCVGVSLAAAAQTRGNTVESSLMVRGNGGVRADRYHLGDDARGASPNFDDSAWNTTSDGAWPSPWFYSDGFVWVRAQVPVSNNADAPLALRFRNSGRHPMAVQVFVNGRLVGAEGGFPPQGTPKYLPPVAIFDLPPGTASPGSTVSVAVRMWFVPRVRRMGSGQPKSSNHGQTVLPDNLTYADFSIGDAAGTHLSSRVDHLSAILASVPDLALNALLGMVGIGLVIFWRWTRRPELAWSSALLISYPVYQYFFVATDLGYLSISYRGWVALLTLLTIPTMFFTVEFIWTVHGLRAPKLRRLCHASWGVFNAGTLIAAVAIHPSALIHSALIAATGSVQLFNLITLGANLWVLFVRRYNRVLAAAMAIIPIGSALGHLGIREHWLVGPVDVGLFDIGSLLSGFAIAAMLIQRAISDWQEGNNLRVEFDAAREVQQRLVVAPPEVRGFRMESAYIPATQVGGDFYHIRPDDAGGVLIAVGDVSGKGLRAAMAVSAIIGALRAMPILPPSRVLFDLNRGLTGNLGGGFVTCSVTHIAADGKMIIANAGHLPPYRNGIEIDCGFGLPLGVTTDSAAFAEHEVQLVPGDTLTLLTDGVVEARNATGELYGFDRTRQISHQSAAEIARTAQQFGQEDDITVLTLTRLAVGEKSPTERIAPVLTPA